jgi:curved DNA-binding protein CbpA
MANKQLKIKRARQNIKLLEEADHVAISKVDEPKYKKILTEQERQLHHYLAQYLDPDYLPAGIAKEYEFPKYFYYTVNSKQHGIVQRRTRTDSAMFKRFMKNKAKKAMAKEQGIFRITEQPINIKIDMPGTKNKIKSEFSGILGDINLGDYEVKKNYTSPSMQELLELLEEEKKVESDLVRRKQEEKKINMANEFTILGLTPKATISDAKKAYKKLALMYHPDKAKGNAEKFVIIDTAYKNLLKILENRQSIDENKKPVSIHEDIINKKAEVKALKKDLTKTRDERMKRIILSEIDRLNQLIKDLTDMVNSANMAPAPEPTQTFTKKLKNKFRLQVIKNALDKEIINRAEHFDPTLDIKKKYTKQYKIARQNADFKNAMNRVYDAKQDIEHNIPQNIKKLENKRREINARLKITNDGQEIKILNADKRDIAKSIKFEKSLMERAIKELPVFEEYLTSQKKQFYNRGPPTVEIPRNAHKMTIRDLLNIGLTKSQIASIKGEGLKKVRMLKNL